MGISGRIEVWHQGAAFPALILDITKAAKLAVREDEKRGPEFIIWRAPPPETGRFMPRGGQISRETRPRLLQ